MVSKEIFLNFPKHLSLWNSKATDVTVILFSLRAGEAKA